MTDTTSRSGGCAHSASCVRQRCWIKRQSRSTQHNTSIRRSPELGKVHQRVLETQGELHVIDRGAPRASSAAFEKMSTSPPGSLKASVRHLSTWQQRRSQPQ